MTDQSKGANGAPAVSNEGISSWMKYLYMQQPKPTNVIGITVSLDVIDANDNYRNIDEVVTVVSGTYSFAWQPDIPGKYTVIAAMQVQTRIVALLRKQQYKSITIQQLHLYQKPLSHDRHLHFSSRCSNNTYHSNCGHCYFSDA